MEAAPELWPTLVLTAPPLEEIDPAELHYVGHADCFQQAHDKGTSRAVGLLTTSARLSPFAWRVKLEGFRDHVRLSSAGSWQHVGLELITPTFACRDCAECWQHPACGAWLVAPLSFPSLLALQPALVPCVLLALPRGVRILELAAHCAGPVLEALQPLTRLQELRISGSGAGIIWTRRGAAVPAVLPKLVQLRLDYRGRPSYRYNYSCSAPVPSPRHIGDALVAATRLRSLGLCASWGDGVPALCFALPALLELR